MQQSRSSEQLDLDELLTVSKEPRRYEFIILQHPEIARATSPSEKDRRVVDPPCILQLKIYDSRGNLDDKSSAMRSPFWVVQAMLEGPHQMPFQLLQGQLASSASYVAAGWAHDAGCYFVFSDLTITKPGLYHLKFLLTTVRPLPARPDELPVLGEAHAKAIRAYPQREFPGTAASSDLAKSLADHKVSISIKLVDNRNPSNRT
ncbi:hypothetical protein E3P94_03509 [Wallemia ichthyophaga]|nr:hypothetical protein E3P98_03572 [Wallemia ichthyophaga]TIA95906.1 hypothetical protein E3P95_03502 [Wallemia ichthyophaga]TIA96947.1 hypothetical protein E3P94_03509 [Wallemia ichthyophaga]